MAHPSLTGLELGPTTTLHIGDALDVLTTLPSTSVDAVITDPPYAIKRVPANHYARPPARLPDCSSARCEATQVCDTCARADAIAKFSTSTMLGQQSQNWHARETHSRGYADNDPAQFQHWCNLWLTECLRILKPGGHLIAFGGTRTWHRLVTAAEDTGFEIRDSLAWLYSTGMPKSLNVPRALSGAGRDDLAKRWDGAGTTLRPAFEPILLARRPLDGTMVNNLTTWNVGPLNLAAARHHTTPPDGPPRWPSNVHMDHETARALTPPNAQDTARAFWVAKPTQAERPQVNGLAHPAVKPLDLMRRLTRLVTAPGGAVLDPFVGSGTTLEACLQTDRRCIGIERDHSYLPLIEERMGRQDVSDDAQSTGDPLLLF